ncbi:MAG: nicotinamide-nucleotide amidohydrolase family protein [Magnetococcales bacterium]|nr:nicotinamide-nucleotide amidohydrolase family protein [Magnetococcales bacterium]
MKCLLIMPRWSEQESLFPPSGRPYLDLQLECLGFSEMGFSELEPDAPFDPTRVAEEYQLILIQGTVEPGNRLRRSLLSNLGLSLGLDSDESDRLRVMGARPLYDGDGMPAGFAIKRRGRMVIYCEKSIWGLRRELVAAIREFMEDGIVDTQGMTRRGRYFSCWLAEGSESVVSSLVEASDLRLCRIRVLSNGDTALMIPAQVGAEFKERLQERLGDRLYSKSPRPLEMLVGKQLREANVAISVAESCTGGLITARLSSVPGSSAYLSVGYVTYANMAKSQCLDVNPVLIERCGAVSPEVALAMARGALRSSGAHFAVSATGVAGPDGGTEEKPVGTVFLAGVSLQGDVLEHASLYQGSRDRIRYQTSQTALHLFRRLLRREPQE